ncbi:hypothetical protein TZ03_11315 [Pseudomonas sp. 10-1B]|nr:hypothetical protein TZ03_11315 [Pseudomonas sp. 10-1B]
MTNRNHAESTNLPANMATPDSPCSVNGGLDDTGNSAAETARKICAAAVVRAKKTLNYLDVAQGMAELEGTAARVAVDEKRIINCRADLNQLVLLRYDWAWQKYLDGCANHWMLQEINMTADIALWKSQEGLTEDAPHRHA